MRFYENGKWSDVHEIRSNQPGEYHGYWFFQAQWDPGNEAITILGVGNRKGVDVMLLGVCLSILGMIWAFYIKPSILRRRRAASAADGSSASTGGAAMAGVRGKAPRERVSV